MIQSSPKSRWWVEPVWRLYERLPAAADDVLKWRFRYTLPFRNLRIPVAILRGSTRLDGQPGTLVIAGAEHTIDYMIRRFFGGEYQRETVGTVPLWNLGGTLKHLRTSADLTIVRIDQLSARLLFGADYLAVPEWIGSTLPVPEDPAKLARRNYSLRNDWRKVRRNDLRPDITHADSDFETFYHTMCVPFISMRYGKQAIIGEYHRMRRIFRQGGLILVRHDGKSVAGLLFQHRNQQLRSVAFGTINGERAPVEIGAFAALYFFLVKHAKESGCKLIDFGGSRPSLSDGVLRYKRNWGVNLIDKRDAYYDFLVQWNSFNGVVASFLSHTPLIFRDNGGFSAIYSISRDEPVTQIEALKIHRLAWIVGLQRLYFITTSGWQKGVSNPPQTRLIDIEAVGDLTPDGLNEKNVGR